MTTLQKLLGQFDDLLLEYVGDNVGSGCECGQCQASRGVVKKAISKLLTQVQEEARGDVIKLIKDNGPDLVLPITEPPFREDYINKWKLIALIKKGQHG